MKIIQANKFLYPKGGADKYCLSLIRELSGLGHDIIPYAMTDSRNIISSYSSYFCENIDYDKPANRLKAAARLIWNREAAKKFAKLLDDTKPDIIHCHNIYHQLSPSILKEGKKRNIPIIMTLHDYKLICPNYKLYNKGLICERCVKGSYINCLKNRCYGSYSRSALASLESYLHNKVWKTYRKNVDLFISPSEFLKRKMIEAGWNDKKIIVLNNPADTFTPSPGGDNLLYFGRLAPEKGIDCLIKALKMTDERLDIIGSGPEEGSLKELSQGLGLENRVTFHEKQDGENLDIFIKKAKAVILPSIWHENMSLSILESLSRGKIVIASASGGTPELVKDEETGFLFPPGDIEMLAKKIMGLRNLSQEKRKKLLGNIQAKVEPLNLSVHLKDLVNIYEVLKNR